MKTRHVYSTTDLAQAREAMQAARDAGIGDDCLTLVARSDIELDAIPNKDREASGDFMHGDLRAAKVADGCGRVARRRAAARRGRQRARAAGLIISYSDYFAPRKPVAST